MEMEINLIENKFESAKVITGLGKIRFVFLNLNLQNLKNIDSKDCIKIVEIS